MALRFDITVCLALAVLARSNGARADDSIPLRLDYSAPRSCPDAEAFFAEVAARTPLARPARADEAATVLSVVVKDVPGGNAGTLALTYPDQATSLREVSAADCEQVVAALALMTALAVDPHASAVPADPAPRPRSAPKIAPKPPPAVRTSASHVSVELGALVEALGGVAPEPVWLVRPFVQVALESDSAWSYALRLSAARAHAKVSSSAGSGDFTLWAGRLELCPFRLSFAPGIDGAACVPLEVGRLEAEGRAVVPSERVARPWLSIGGIGRVEWQVFDILVLDASAELLFPIVRDRFFVGENATLHRAPVVAGGATLGIGVRFP